MFSSDIMAVRGWDNVRSGAGWFQITTGPFSVVGGGHGHHDTGGSGMWFYDFGHQQAPRDPHVILSLFFLII